MFVSKLKLKNFMNVSECDLDFSQGINVIGGATGNGKSTIFAAQAFCLSGSKRGDSWKDFIKIGSDKMEIDMTLYRHVGDEPMFFHIEGLASGSSISREIKYKNEYAKNSECDTLLSKYFDSDMMENVLFHLQDSVSVTNITSAKRRELLKKIFNSDFSSVVDTIKEDIIKYKDEIKVQEARMGVLSSLTFEEKMLDRIPNINIDSIKKEIDSLQNEIYSTKELITAKKSILDTIIDERNRLKLELKNFSQQENALTNKIKEYETYIQSNSIDSIQKEINESKEGNIALSQEIKLLKGEIDDIVMSIEGKDVLVKELLESKIKLNSEIESYKKQLKVFDTNSVCPTCGQSCSLDHKQTLENLLLEKESLFDEAKNKYDIENGILQDNINKKLKLEKEVATNSSDLRTSEVSIKHLEDKLEKTTIQLNQYSSWLSKDTEELFQLKNKKEECEKKLNTISEGKNESDITNTISILQSSVEDNEKQIQERRRNIQNVETLILLNKEKEEYNKTLLLKKEENQKEINTIKTTIEGLKKEIVDLDYIKSVFDSDLPNHIMTKACSFLESGINNVLSSTKDNFQIKLEQTTKGIDFFYKARNEPEWLKAKMASGFESNLLTLAFKFTVAMAYDTKYIIFDEPDKSADELSSLKLIETITKIEGFDQVFITTHRPQAIEYLKDFGATIFVAENGEYIKY